MPSRRSAMNLMRDPDPAAAAWRSEQAQVDADIEGLARDAKAEQLVAEMDAADVPIDRQIERLKAYFRTRWRLWRQDRPLGRLDE